MAKVITFTHQKGGVGKSTLSFNLAQNICKIAKVCLVDIDKQGSNAMIKNMVDDFEIFYHEGSLKSIPNYDADFIIVDTPPYIQNESHLLHDISDIIVIPTKAGLYDLLAVQTSIEDVKSSGNENKIMVVFNMIKNNANITESAIENVKQQNVNVAKTIINDYVVFASSPMTNGVESHSKAQAQIDDLTKEILNKL